jgi:WS/DGAT/MGAT family acyltransferase
MRLTESDAGFLYGETASGSLQTAGIAVIDGEVPFEHIYEHIAARLHLVPSFRRRAVWVPLNLAHPKWVDDPDFELANHIVHHEMPPGTSLLEAVDAAVKLNEGLMDRNRPLWKYFVITGVPDRTLLLQQIHHAMIDGASAIHLSTVLYDFQPDAPPPPAPEQDWNPAPLPTPLELMSEAFRENAESFAQNNPFTALTQGSESRDIVNSGMQAMSRFITQPAITAPWNATMLGPQRNMRWSTYGFDELRDIRRALGGTVNDVVLSAVSEGAARYLKHHDEQTADQYLRLMCPVNVRTEDEAGALGNRVSAMFPTLPAWPMGAVERHERVREETQRIKDTQEAQALTLMQETGITTPPVAFAPLQLIGTPFDPTAMAASMPMPLPPQIGPRPPLLGINFVCTNVPGVQVPQFIAGHEVLETTAIMMLGGNMGYGIAVTSYNQKMIFSFTCEPRLLPDLERMVEEVDAAFQELRQAAT